MAISVDPNSRYKSRESFIKSSQKMWEKRFKERKDNEHAATVERRVNSLLDQGWSFEDISKDTGLNTDSVREFVDFTRPGYGTKNGGDKRGLLSKTWDQLNVADSGRSWGRAAPDMNAPQKDTIDQLGDVASGLFSGVEKLDDSVQALTGQTERNQAMREKIFNDLIDQVNAKLEADPDNEDLKRAKENILKKRSELLASDLKDTEWAGSEDKGTLDRLKTAGGVSLEATSEVVPFLKGAKAASMTAKGGAAFGAATGLTHGVGGELNNPEGFDLKRVALETVLGGVAGGIGGAFAQRSASRSLYNYDGPITDEARLLPEFASDATQATDINLTGKVEASNFTRPDVDPKLTAKLAEVESKIAALQQGGATTAADARALFRERAQLIRQIQNPEAPKVRATGQQVIQTNAPKEAGRIKRAIISVKGEFSNLGKGGKEIAARLDDMEAIAETSVGRWSTEAPTLFKSRVAGGLGKKEFTQFVDALETLRNGGQVKVSPKVQKAIDEWVAIAPKIRQEALDVGLDVGDLGPYYFPKNYSQLSNAKELNKAAQHLVDTGQAANLGEAQNALRIMRKASRNKPYGHLEMERVLDLPVYDKTKASLAEYLGATGQRIGRAKNFGAKGEVADELIDQIGKEGFDIDRASRNLRIAFGDEEYSQARKNVSSFARQFNAFRSLRQAAISNAGQTTNTATVAGYLNTLKAGLKMFHPDTRKFITQSGTTSDAVLQKMVNDYGITGFTSKISAPIFGAVEKFNRSLASSAGEVYATKLAKKAAAGNAKAMRDLKRLGVTGEIGKELTDAQRIQAARGLVERTQFKVGAKDMPAWTTSPEGRMAVQFRTFTYKQTGFMYNEILKPLSEGNVAPLLRFSAALPIGLGVAYGKNAARTKLEGGKDYLSDMGWTERVIDAYSSMGALGFGGDVKFAAEQYGNYGTGFEEAIAGSVGGPTAGYIAGTLFDIGDARGGEPTGLVRRGIEAVGGPAGKAVSNRVAPYKSNSLAGDGRDEFGTLMTQLSEETGYSPKLPSREQRGTELDDEQYDKYLSTYKLYYSQMLNQVANTEAFKSASPGAKKEVLKAITTRAGVATRDAVLGPEDDDKKDTLNSLQRGTSKNILKSAGL